MKPGSVRVHSFRTKLLADAISSWRIQKIGERQPLLCGLYKHSEHIPMTTRNFRFILPLAAILAAPAYAGHPGR